MAPESGDDMAEPEEGNAVLARSAAHPAIFELLVARHSTELHGYLARRAPDVADDLLAEVWLTAFRRRRDFDPELGSIPGWLFGMARMHLLAHRRSVATRARRAKPEDHHLDDGGWSAVDARLDAAAAGTALRHAPAQLPEVERELLLLTAWEDLTPTQAAEVLGIPAGTARSRLHRARAGMRERLGPLDLQTSTFPTHRTEPDRG